MIFVFASCNNNATPSETESGTNSGTTTTNSQDITNNETENTDDVINETNSNKPSASLVGEWVCSETVSPKSFYGEYYNSAITKTDIKLVTTYKFNNNGTFSTGISIENISEVRKEYRSLVVEGARQSIEAQGKYLTTDDVLKYESYADSTLKEICSVQKGNYKIQGDMIVYKIGDKTYYETFTISDNELILTGSSTQTVGYPITLTKVKK